MSRYSELEMITDNLEEAVSLLGKQLRDHDLVINGGVSGSRFFPRRSIDSRIESIYEAHRKLVNRFDGLLEAMDKVLVRVTESRGEYEYKVYYDLLEASECEDE